MFIYKYTAITFYYCPSHFACVIYNGYCQHSSTWCKRNKLWTGQRYKSGAFALPYFTVQTNTTGPYPDHEYNECSGFQCKCIYGTY